MNKTFTWYKFLLESELELLNEFEERLHERPTENLKRELSPSDESIKKILGYAHSYHAISTNSIGDLELNLN